MSTVVRPVAAIALLSVSVGTPVSGATLYGPTPYLSTADSPFNGHAGWVVEDFEDGTLMAGITNSAGGPYGPASNCDSVDADDGSTDGHGTAGHSFFSSNGGTGVRFTFDPNALGGLPLSAGLVWTDGAGTITFEAFDESSQSLGTIVGTHADGTFFGTTAEDRFYGVSHAGGISSIFIRNSGGGIEVDHVQFSFAVPAPSALPLASLALMGVRRRRTT